MSMKITEEDPQHLVIVTTRGIRIFGVFLMVFAIIVLVIFIPICFGSPVLILVFVVAVPFMYFGVWFFRGKRLVFEKSTNSIILEGHNYLLTRKKRIIPFTEVNSVEIAYKMIPGAQGGPPRDGWQVSLDAGGKTVVIDHTTNRESISTLAHKISQFMGKELVWAKNW